MSKISRYVYDSEKKTLDSGGRFANCGIVGYAGCSIAHGFISTTEILFAKEEIIARIEARGEVEFLNPEGEKLASARAPSADGPRGKYVEAYCTVEDDKIKIRFPIFEWYDNYPHCDGEYDRWDPIGVTGHTAPIVFSLSTGQACMEEE